MNACEAMLHLLAEAGVRYLFGNPGTTELPLSDALVDHPRIQYILGLQEVPVLAMTEGFAQASRLPGVANVHISCSSSSLNTLPSSPWSNAASTPTPSPR